MAASSSTAAGRRSWQGTADRGAYQTSKSAWRWVLTALVLLLVALAIYLVITRWSGSRTLLVYLDNDRKERVTIPLVPYLKSDRAAVIGEWSAPTGMYAAHQTLADVPSWQQLVEQFTQGSGFFRNARDQSVALTGRDTLVLYIRAHGLVADLGDDNRPDVRPVLIKSLGEAELAGDWTKGQTLDVGTLLEHIAKTHAGVKTVVVLDVVHVNYDPRLGVLGNSFAEQVERCWPENAPNLWVLLTTTGDELTTAAPQQGRSTFSVCLLDSLRETAGQTGPLSVAALVDDLNRRLEELPREDNLSWVEHAVLLPRPDKRLSTPPLLPRIAMTPADKEADAPKDAAPSDKPVKTAWRTRTFDLQSGPPALALQQTDAGAKTETKAEDKAESPPAPAEAAKEEAKSAAVASDKGASTAPSLTPPASAAPPAPDKPLTDRDLFEQDLLAAWDLRDRLDQLAIDKNQWSPALVAPPRWRRIEAQLISFEERFLHGETDDRQDRSDLAALRSSLAQLLARFEGQAAAADIADADVRALDAAYDRILSGATPAATATLASFGKSQSNPLVRANAAVRQYAHAAYRLSDYVRLHGLLTCGGAEGSQLAPLIDSLLDRLIAFRAAVQSASGASLTDQTLESLEAALQEVASAHHALDEEIASYVQSIADASHQPDAGVMLRARLLPSSAAVRAPQRRMLYPLVWPRPAAAGDAIVPKVPVPATANRSSSAVWNASAALREHVPLLAKTMSLLTGDEAADPPFSDLATAFARFPGERMPAAALGRHLRQFHEQLPDQIRKQYSLRCEGGQQPTAIDLWGLYHLMLLVDGRDAQRQSVAGITVGLAQPIPPMDIPNEIVEFQFDRERLDLLASDMTTGAAVKLDVALRSEEDASLPLELELQFSPRDVLLRWADTGDEIKPGKVTRMLASKNASLGLLVSPARIPQPNETGTTRLVVGANFRGAKATDTLELALPRPHEIEVILAADAGTGAIDTDRSVVAGPSSVQTPMVKLFPGRQTSFRLDVHNLASDKMEVRVFLLAPPQSPERPPGHNLGLLRRLPDGMDSLVQILLKEPLDSPRFQQFVVAQTDAKQPPFALSAGATVPIPLVPKAAAASAGEAAPVNLAGGLVCVVASDAPVPNQRFLRWLDLNPYDPDELFEADNFAYRNRKLSFDLRIKDPKLAAGWDLLSRPLVVQWDRTADGQPNLTAQIDDPRSPAIFSTMVGSGQSEHIIQLHIDGYPRALVYDVRIDAASGTVAARNIKKDELDAVHIAGLNLKVDGRERAAYKIRPVDPVLPQRLDSPKQPAAAADGANGDSPPPPRPITLTRDQGSDPAAVAFRYTKDDGELALFVDLQADVPSSVFVGGGSIRLAIEGQGSRTLYRDRDAQLSLAGIEGPLLKLSARVSDYEQLQFDPGVNPAAAELADVRTTLQASVIGGQRTGSLGGYSGHRLPLIFDANSPEVTIASVQPAIVRSLKQKVTFRVDADDGRGSGVQSVKVRFGADANANGELDGMEGSEPKNVKVVPAAEGRFAVEFTLPPELKNGRYLVAVDAVDGAGHVGQTGSPLRVDVLGSIPDNPTLPKVKGKKKDEEKAGERGA